MHEQFHESAAYKLESRAEGALILPMNEHTVTITATADNETDRPRAGIGSRGGQESGSNHFVLYYYSYSGPPPALQRLNRSL
jgi:hypothetical protein